MFAAILVCFGGEVGVLERGGGCSSRCRDVRPAPRLEYLEVTCSQLDFPTKQTCQLEVPFLAPS